MINHPGVIGGNVPVWQDSSYASTLLVPFSSVVCIFLRSVLTAKAETIFWVIRSCNRENILHGFRHIAQPKHDGRLWHRTSGHYFGLHLPDPAALLPSST